MVFSSWYTDLVDIYRIRENVANGLTSQTRMPVAFEVPCRIYKSQVDNYSMPRGAARILRAEKLACDAGVDIQEGDELLVTRGGVLGRGRAPVRYFAGQPQIFFDPVGGALTGLEHQEVGLLADELARTGVV